MQKNTASENEIKIILKFCQFLGLVVTTTKQIHFKTFTACLFVISLGGFIFSTWGKITQMPKYNSIVKFTDCFANFFLTLTGGTVCIHNIFIYPMKMSACLAEIQQFDVNLPARNKKPSMDRIFWITLIVAHVSFFVTVVTDTVFWATNLDLAKYHFFIVRNFQCYKLFIMLFLVFWLTFEINFRFVALNIYLKDTFQKSFINPVDDGVKTLQMTKVKREKFIRQLRKLSKMHFQLCDILDEHNSTFGILLLLSIIFTIIHCIQHTATLIYYGFMIQNKEPEESVALILIASLLWVIQSLVSIQLFFCIIDLSSLAIVNTVYTGCS